MPGYVWWLTQSKALWIYLKLAVWPWPLVIHYEMPFLDTFGAAWPWLLAAALLVIVTLVLLWRRAAAGFVGAWVLLILSPTLLVPIITELAAERRMYLPLAALVTLAIAGAYVLLQMAAQWIAPGARRGAMGVWPQATIAVTASLLVVVLGLVSIRRLAAYEDDMTMWQDALVYQPQNATVHTCLALALRNEGRPQEAIEHYEQALRLNSHSAEAHIGLGLTLASLGQWPEAIEHYQQARRRCPIRRWPMARWPRPWAPSAGRKEALPHFQEELRLDPYSAESHRNVGLALTAVDRRQEAIKCFEQALVLKPDYLEAHNSLGLALSKTDRPEEAIAHFEQALQIRQDVRVYLNLAMAFAQMGQSGDAQDAAEKALQLAHSQGRSDETRQIEAWLTAYREKLSRPQP